MQSPATTTSAPVKPWKRACDAWLEENPGGDFAVLLAFYMQEGFVYNGDDAFVLARPVGEPVADTWFIHLASGPLMRFQAFKLPFIGWHRRGILKKYRWDRFESLARSWVLQ